uniref:AAA+ ATPase domain-containing protein n=1 Tax=viral metagenome TaxID=1070528 RepID=A0A6C0J633_9ZZZZ
MFLVDKYSQCNQHITFNEDIVDKILDSFDTHTEIYNNLHTIFDQPKNIILSKLKTIQDNSIRYANFHHLIVYGPEGNNKEYIVNRLLQKIYGEKMVKLQDVEYIISGYSNTKTKVIIKQSKCHIVIEPNNNGFDKYLIQEIIQDYAKTEILTILKYKKLFKIVVIDKIDNLSYYAQASLRRTMEKYANICKFIFISNQLSKIIEPIKSRCILIKVPLPQNNDIVKTLLEISTKEKIKLEEDDLKLIINKVDNKLNNAIWLLEFKKNKMEIEYESWKYILDDLIQKMMVCQKYNNKYIKDLIIKMRESVYILFITNIKFQLIIRTILKKLLEFDLPINIKYHIINSTSIFENRITQGTRNVIHLEAYIIQIIYILNYKNNIHKLNYISEIELLEI